MGLKYDSSLGRWNWQRDGREASPRSTGEWNVGHPYVNSLAMGTTCGYLWVGVGMAVDLCSTTTYRFVCERWE